mgnify:CR=1 FL=1
MPALQTSVTASAQTYFHTLCFLFLYLGCEIPQQNFRYIPLLEYGKLMLCALNELQSFLNCIFSSDLGFGQTELGF